MLDEGRYGTVTELAAGEKLDLGYLGKILVLTLLAPDIAEAIMDGRQPAELGVHVLRQGFPVEWGGAEGHLRRLTRACMVIALASGARCAGAVRHLDTPKVLAQVHPRRWVIESGEFGTARDLHRPRR